MNTNKIEVAVVYADGTVGIYGVAHNGSDVRPLLRKMKFATYGHALQFAIEFEEKQMINVSHK